jgi:hypothetical protein
VALKHAMLLDFVWHLRGSVPLAEMSDHTAVLDSVEQLLEKQQQGASERSSDYVVFDNPLWLNLGGPNWLAMVIYDRGRFFIEQGVSGQKLRYDLRSLHAMVFCLFVAFIAFCFGFADGGITGGLRLAGGVFAWLYGANLLLALLRVPYAIRKAVSSA